MVRRLGRSQQLLVTALAEQETVAVQPVVENHLGRRPTRSELHAAHLDDSCQGTDYVLRKPVSIRRSWGDLFGLFRRQGVYTYRIPQRDENGARTLSRLRDYGINAAAQSADRVLDFFLRLRWELGFYLGALHLHQRLRQAGAPVCLPIARPAEDMALTARNLCDVGLVLRGTGAVVGNDLDADGKTLVMVTGAKEGGESTVLRSLGLAQLMMQAGLFVAADGRRTFKIIRANPSRPATVATYTR